MILSHSIPYFLVLFESNHSPHLQRLHLRFQDSKTNNQNWISINILIWSPSPCQLPKILFFLLYLKADEEILECDLARAVSEESWHTILNTQNSQFCEYIYIYICYESQYIFNSYSGLQFSWDKKCQKYLLGQVLFSESRFKVRTHFYIIFPLLLTNLK